MQTRMGLVRADESAVRAHAHLHALDSIAELARRLKESAGKQAGKRMQPPLCHESCQMQVDSRD